MSAFSFKRPLVFQRLPLFAAVAALCGGLWCSVSQGGMVALPRNWTVTNPNYTDAQMGAIFTVNGAVPPDASTDAIPIKISLAFPDFNQRSFTFTNSFAKDTYTGAPHNGNLGASVNAYSRFSANFELTNGTANIDWTGFIFDIKDNVPGRTVDSEGDGISYEDHPLAAHFHATTTGAFATSLAPFTDLARFPEPADAAKFKGFSTGTVTGGATVGPGNTWQPMGLGLHNNITFNPQDANQTSFTLNLTPLPEPTSLTLLSLGGLAYVFHRFFAARKTS